MLPLVLLVACLGGCVTAQPILRLTPRSSTGKMAWLAGVPIVSQQGRHSRVAVAFAREQDGRHGIRVEVQNQGEKTLLLDSRNFSYRICHRVAGSEEKCGLRYQVADPEAAILALEMKRRRDQAANMNAEMFHTTMALLGATGEIASGKHTGATHLALDQANAARDTEHAEALAFALAQSNWELRSFRKTTTGPGQSVAGLVFIDQDPGASAVILYATIDDEFYTFPFDQSSISPYPHAGPPNGGYAGGRR